MGLQNQDHAEEQEIERGYQSGWLRVAKYPHQLRDAAEEMSRCSEGTL